MPRRQLNALIWNQGRVTLEKLMVKLEAPSREMVVSLLIISEKNRAHPLVNYFQVSS